MSYVQLREFCQNLQPYVRRNAIYGQAIDLTGRPRVKHFRTTLDITACRGFYLSAQNTNHQFVAQAGTCVIVTARDLNTCWERFVYIKELMHLFDDPISATDTGDAFEELLGEFTAPGITKSSPQMISEVKAFWMALACLCPEAMRLEMKEQRLKNQIDDYTIALRLRIPEQYVSRLFDSNYEKIMDAL